MPQVSRFLNFKSGYFRFACSALCALLVVVSVKLAVFGLLLKDSATRGLISVPASHYAGLVHQGDVFSCNFEIKNLSGVPIQVSNVRSSCSCVSIKGIDSLLEGPLSPNGTARVWIGVEALGLTREMEGLARLHYQLDGKDSYLDLVVKASVLEDYKLRLIDSEGSADVVNIGKFTEFSDMVQRVGVTLVPMSNRSVDIMNVHFNAEGLKLISQSNRDFFLEYSCPRFEHATNIRVPVVVETTSENKPKALLMLTGEYIPAVQASPEAIALASGDAGTTRRMVTVTTAEPSRIKLVDTRGSPARVVSGSISAENKVVHELIVEVPEGSEFWKGEVYVVLEIGSKEYTKVVPIVRF